MRGLVISGGGSKGSFAGGIIEYLKEIGKDWDIFTGTSTGSLITPMVAANKLEDLKKAYTNINPSDVFSVNPFRIKEKKSGEIKFGVNHFAIAYNLIWRGSKTLGDSSNLRKSIPNFLTLEDYQKIIESKKEVLITVSNLTKESLEVKSIREESYQDFCDWMAASCSATPFMSVFPKNNMEYADGGLLRFLPLIEALQIGARDIDAIVLDEKTNKEKEPINNVLGVMIKMIKIFLGTRKKYDSDVEILSRQIPHQEKVRIRFYYLSRKLTNNPYVFDSRLMTKWWEEGYDWAKNQNFVEIFI